MKRSRLTLLVVLLAAWPATSRSEDAPLHRAEDPAAPAVSEQNLLASERFWPYQVALTRAWQASGREQPLAEGSQGVLIRVEANGRARVDFGREGLHEVPVGETDLVERANQVRRGELHKLAPNLVLAIGPRLLDSGSTPPLPLGMARASEPVGFLCVFADPRAASFAELAAALAPLGERHGVAAVLFPQGEHPDLEVAERLRALGWTVPFVYDGLAEAYTRTLVSGGAPLPVVLVATREGRLLFEGAWGDGVVAKLSAALEEGFGGAHEGGGAASLAPVQLATGP
jgi:hypothetical protein